jgi:hypothetical protein
MAQRALTWFGVAALCASFVGGCKASGDDDNQPISQDQLPGVLAGLFCDSFGACCAADSLPFDRTNCVAYVTASQKQSLDESTALGARYDAQAAGNCAAAVKDNIRCAATDSAVVNAACNAILVGTRAIGQECNSNRDCAPPGFCDLDVQTGASICATPAAAPTFAHGQSGQLCDLSCDEAADCGRFIVGGAPIGGDPNQPIRTPVACYRSEGLYCNGNCTKIGAIGETCQSFDGCQDGLFCDQNARICAAPHPNGAPCQGDGECQSNNCSATHVCDDPSVTGEQCASGRLSVSMP